MADKEAKIKGLKKPRTKVESRDKKPDQGNKVSFLDAVKGKVGFIEKVKQFLREVKVEFKKVVWPSRKETLGTTVVVIIVVSITALFLGVIDMTLARLIRIFIS